MKAAKMRKLVIDDAIPFLKGRLEEHFSCMYVPGNELRHALLTDADGLLVRTRTRCNEAMLGGTPVSFVATGTIGLDHFDIPWLENRHIRWQNAPGCNAPAVAQYVWSSLLRLGVHPGEGRRPVVGVVGKGNVGSIVVEWGRRLGAEMIVCDPPRQRAGMTDEDYISLPELASRADAVTFHTPLTRSGEDATWHLCDEGVLERLRPGAVLVNAARGGVVEEEALRRVAKRKNLRLAIDTWEGEPQISTETLYMAEIATPHIAGYSIEGKQRATLAILRGLMEHFGVTLPVDGLADPYTPPETLTEEIILSSFDPAPLGAALRAAPAGFETMRDSYRYRAEIPSSK